MSWDLPFTDPGGPAGEPASDPQDYWLSYSDLMAGLLMVFALMLLVALYHYQSGVEGVREILVVRQEMVEALQQEFQEGPEKVVEVRPDGTIRFTDRILFDQGSAVIRPEGREQLRAFATQYLGVLFGIDRFRDQLEAIVIEGHTNDDGDYFLNLRLSQDRALAVMQTLLEESPTYEADLQRFATANGRSEAELICVGGAVSGPSGCGEAGVDKIASRRIEIRFELQDERILRQVLEAAFPG